MAFFATCSQVHATTAMLRVACDGSASNAEVTINGEFRGDCPVDVPVAAGNLSIRVTKKVDSERELVFEQEFRMVAGTVKRIDVEFGSPQLNAEGLRLLAVRQRQREDARKAEIAANFERQRLAAENGDARAMVELAEAYEKGNDKLSRDLAQALTWYSKAATAGNAEAMYHMIDKDPAQAKVWLRKAALAGHAGAKAQLDRIPRFCQGYAEKAGIFGGQMFVSAGFEHILADGTESPVKAIFVKYIAKLQLLQPGVWDEAVNGRNIKCKLGPTVLTDYLGNGISCEVEMPPRSGFGVLLQCGNRGEQELRKQIKEGVFRFGVLKLPVRHDWLVDQSAD